MLGDSWESPSGLLQGDALSIKSEIRLRGSSYGPGFFSSQVSTLNILACSSAVEAKGGINRFPLVVTLETSGLSLDWLDLTDPVWHVFASSLPCCLAIGGRGRNLFKSLKMKGTFQSTLDYIGPILAASFLVYLTL